MGRSGDDAMPHRFIVDRIFPASLTRRNWLGGAACSLLMAGCRRSEVAGKPGVGQAAGKLRQEIYVWQRLWTPAVAASVTMAQERGLGLSILAAEVEWSEAQPRLIRPKVDWKRAAHASGGVGLAVRIGPWSGPFGAEDAVTRRISGWIRETLTQAREGGCEPVELQIDFDAATSKLAGYRNWLRVFRKAVTPLPVSCTVLPDWLRSPLLQEMVRECGSYVLQVHAVERARADEAAPRLLHADSARRWVEQAAALGVPFRVALPTYRSVVGFDADGKIVGIDSEGPARVWPRGTKVVTFVSPATEIAGLVEQWTRGRPAMLQGILWYRLPVAGESRNWTWKTLEPVMAGRAPLGKLLARAEGGNPMDIFLANEGEAEVSWPESVLVQVPASSGGITAADALGGYVVTLDPAAPHRAVFHRNSGETLHFLLPEARKPLGWLRTQSTVTAHEITISIP